MSGVESLSLANIEAIILSTGRRELPVLGSPSSRSDFPARTRSCPASRPPARRLRIRAGICRRHRTLERGGCRDRPRRSRHRVTPQCRVACRTGRGRCRATPSWLPIRLSR